MKNFFIKIWNFFKSIPLYGYIISISLFLIQTAVYMLTKQLLGKEYYLQHGWIPHLPIDDFIPLIPFFSIFYYFSYSFWLFGVAYAAKHIKKEEYFDICFSIVLAVIISLVIFIVKPSYMIRSQDKWIIESYDKKGLFYDLWRVIVRNDGREIGYNLFPSFHCLWSFYTYFMVHRRKEVPLGYRIFSLVTMLLIFLCVVFIKQHYFLDIIGAISIGSILMLFVKFVKPMTHFLSWKETKKQEEQH